MDEYHVIKIRVHEKDKLYGYFHDMCVKAKNLYNYTNCLIRQNMSGLKKEVKDRQPLEKEKIQETITGITLLNQKRQENYVAKVAGIMGDGSLS